MTALLCIIASLITVVLEKILLIMAHFALFKKRLSCHKTDVLINKTQPIHIPRGGKKLYIMTKLYHFRGFEDFTKINTFCLEP